MLTRSLPATAALLTVCASFSFAEETAPARSEGATAAKPMLVAARTTPAPTPAPEKKPGFFGRLFGPSKPKNPVATPAPATPRPFPRNKRVRPVTEEKPEATETKPADDNTASPTTEKPTKPESTPTPKRSAKGKGAEAPVTAGGDPEVAEKTKFDEVKERAMAEKSVLEMKEKADNAGTDEESRKALRSYNKALFQKMRTLEPSLESRIDRVESAVMRQLDAKAL